ncbi:MAG: class I SAM-dependent methyltransferase [Acidimicrobiales bacterium]
MDRHEWDLRYEGEALAMPAHPNPLLADELATVVPGRALDLGAGEGRHAVWLASTGWWVTAVDFSHNGLAKGKRRAAGLGVEVAWLVADLAEFEPPARFDFVLASFVHFAGAERRAFLARAAGALSPGGIIVVVGYDRSNGPTVGPGRRDPELLLSPEEVAADLAAAGLRVEKAERLKVLTPSPAGDGADPTQPPPDPVEIIDVYVRAARPKAEAVRHA